MAATVLAGCGEEGGDPELRAVLVSADRVELSWEGDAATVERSTDGVTFSTVAEVPRGAGGYSDGGLAGATAFTYRVRGQGVATVATAWSRTYGPGTAVCVRTTADGGFVAAGLSDASGSWDAWIFKTGATGAVEWETRYGTPDDDWANFILPAADGGFVVAGLTGWTGWSEGDAWVLKLAADGTREWERSFGGQGYDEAFGAAAAPGGGIVVSAVTGGDVWLLGLTGGGDVAWQYAYGGPRTEGPSGYTLPVVAAPGGGFVVAATTYSYGAGSSDAWVFKVDASGALVWQNAYGGPGADEASSLAAVGDGYLLGGTLSGAAWVAKLDGAGELLWQACYPGGPGQWVEPASDGGSILSGDGRIVKLDASGAVEWGKAYAGPGDEWAPAMRVEGTADGGYIVGGLGAGWDAWLMKLGRDGTVSGVSVTDAAPAAAPASAATAGTSAPRRTP